MLGVRAAGKDDSPLRALKAEHYENPDFAPQKPKEFSVFEVSSYQTDGWEPFLPDNPLKGTAFEPHAKGFEARRRRLDEAREHTTVGQADDDLLGMVSKRTARALARDGLAADTSQLGALSRGIVLVDHANKKYLASNAHGVTQENIKMFLKAEARRMYAKIGQTDAEVQSILLADAQREGDEQIEDDSSDEDEDYRAILRLLEKLREKPKVIDTIVVMTGSGMGSFLSMDEGQKKKALLAFKHAVGRVTSLTPAEVGIVNLTNMSQKQAGVVVERVCINFQIAVVDADLVQRVESGLRDSIHDGTMGGHMTHAGIQAIVSLRAGPRVFTYDCSDFDATQRIFGEPAKALKVRIDDADLAARGIKPGDEGNLEAGDEEGDAKGQGQILISLVAQEVEETVERQKRRKRGVRKQKVDLASSAEVPRPRTSTGMPGMTLAARPATSMGRVESIIEEQKEIMRRDKEQCETEKARGRRSKSSLASAVDAWAPKVTDDPEKYGDSTQKMSGYFQTVASRKRSAAAGQVSDAVAAARREVLEENEAIKKEAKAIRAAELAKYANDRERAAQVKKIADENAAAAAAVRAKLMDPTAHLNLIGRTASKGETREEKGHAAGKGGYGAAGHNISQWHKSEEAHAPASHGSGGRHRGHGGGRHTGAGGHVEKTRTRIGGGGAGVATTRMEMKASRHVGQIMEAGAWEHGEGSSEEIGFFQQKLRQAQAQAQAQESGQGGLDGWKKEVGGKQNSLEPKKRNDCRWCKNSRKIALDWAKAALKVLWDDKAVKRLEKEIAMIDCPFCVGLDYRIRRGFLKLKRPILEKTNNWKAPVFKPGLDSDQMRRVGDEEAWADETSYVKTPDVVRGVCAGPEYGALVTMTAGGVVVEAEVQTGRVLERCKAPSKAVANCVCMSGRTMYVGMDDGRIREYVSGGEQGGGFKRCMYARQKSIMCVSVSPDGSILASGSIDHTTMVWDTSTGRVLRHVCAVTPSFPELIRKKLSEWDDNAPSIAHAFRHHRGAVSAIVAVKAAVISGSWDSTVCIAYLPVYRERWNDDRAVQILRERAKELGTQISQILEEHAPKRPVGRTLRHMEKLEMELETVSKEQSKREHRMRSAVFRSRKFLRLAGKDVGNLKVNCVAFQKLEGGSYGLFVGYSDGNVRQWDVNSSRVACVIMAHQSSSVTAMTIGVGRLYTGGATGVIKVWDLGALTKEVTRTQRNMLDVVGHDDGIISLQMCGNILLSSSHDLTVRAWDMLSCDAKMKPNNFPETSTEAPQAMRLYSHEEVMFMEEEEERMQRFANADNATKNLMGSVIAHMGLKRAARRARRAIMGDDYTGDDMDELLGEEVLDEGAEFKKMVLDDLMDLTESMPALSTAVKDGTDLAEEFLKTLRTKIKGHDEA